MWIDSHCHLNHVKIKENDSNIKDIIARANSAGIDGMLSVNCRISEEFEEIKNIAESFDNVWCSIGTHPHDAGAKEEKAYSVKDIVNLTSSSNKVIAIGETGLDYFYKNSSIDDQKESFRKHIRVCLETGLPLIVHSRDAEDDTMEIIREEGAGTSLSGVMHCFSSDRKLAEEALDFGFYISFSGIVTFKKSQELRDIAKDIPIDRILTETDAPFLAPEPHRGRICEPALMVHTGEILASLHDMALNDFAKHTSDNFFSLFKKAKLK